MTVSLPPSVAPLWSRSVGGTKVEWRGESADEIISQLIQGLYGAECAGAPAELSIQSPPPAGVKGGKEVARLKEINLPVRLSSQSHHRRRGVGSGKKNVASAFPLVPHPPLCLLALHGDVFVGISREPGFCLPRRHSARDYRRKS